MSNDDTNQTFDYSLINKIEKPEGYSSVIQNDEEDENATPTLNPLTYVHGRLYLNENKVWVFESFKTCF